MPYSEFTSRGFVRGPTYVASNISFVVFWIHAKIGPAFPMTILWFWHDNNKKSPKNNQTFISIKEK